MALEYPSNPTVGQIFDDYIWNGYAWDGLGQANNVGTQIAALNTASPKTVANQAARDALYPVPVQGNSVFRSDLGYIERYHDSYNSSTNKGGITPAGWYRAGNGATAYATYVSTASQSWPAGYITPSSTPTFNFGSSNYATYFSARAAGINLPIRGTYFMRFTISANTELVARNFIELAGSGVTIPGAQRAGSVADDIITGTVIVYSDGGAGSYVTMQGWQNTGTVSLMGFSIQAIYLGNRSE